MMLKKPLRLIGIAMTAMLACLMLIGFGTPGMATDRRSIAQASANIEGNGITGKLSLLEARDGIVAVELRVKGNPAVLTPGLHGVHFHETGVCDATTATKFASAKGHFDPGPFGNTTPVQDNHPFHLGDLPNLQVNAKGEGYLATVTTRASLKSPVNSLLDADGTALIIHRNPDLQKASGTADEAGGARLACGVIK